MSDTVWIALIIAVAVVIIIIVFKDKLKNFTLKANQDGVNANLGAHGKGVTIRKAKLTGESHDMTVTRDNVVIDEPELDGKGHKIHVEK